jgi:hypothetical protein
MDTPSDGISLCKENPPLIYALPVLVRGREIFCKLESTRGKIGSLRPAKAHERGKKYFYSGDVTNRKSISI